MELLLLLVERRGELVTRDEIVQRLWGPDVFLDVDNSINTAISKLRVALRDDPDSPRFIKTVPGKGYRFIAALAGPEPEPVAAVAEAVPGPLPPPPGRRLPRHLWVWPVLGVLAVALWSWLRPPVIHSLAVLPLENLTGDSSQEYFVDGMTDALITDLAQIGSLRVISRTSVMRYKGLRKPLAEIARELGVDAVIEGSVTRSAGRVRITSQLILVAQDRHLWARSFERDAGDVLTLQAEIAAAIASEVGAALTP